MSEDRRVRIAEDDAYEVIEGSVDAPAFLTCEHASERFAPPWALEGTDRRLEGTHWAYDPGAAEITRELAARLDAPAVLARFSRLVVDPNRELDSATLFRDVADGESIALNVEIDPNDRAARIARFYEPYHRAIDFGLSRCSAPIVFPVHTFTHEYEGQSRTMELGVLFDREEELARGLHRALHAAGFRVELNEPWSGKDGLIHSAERHANVHRRRPLELEVRQNLAIDPGFRTRLVPVVAAFLTEAAARLRADATPG